MQSIQIDVNVVALNPKSYVVTAQDGSKTLFSYNVPVVHVNAQGKMAIDAIAWGRSKSTSGHIKTFTGKDKEALTSEILAGTVELARLVAPNVKLDVKDAE
jgi:hypothetical protein